MKHTQTVHVFMQYGYTEDYSRKVWRPEIWGCKVSEEETRVYIGPREVTVDVPDDFDPVPRQVAALEAEKLAALEKYQQSVASINRRLSELQALEA